MQIELPFKACAVCQVVRPYRYFIAPHHKRCIPCELARPQRSLMWWQADAREAQRRGIPVQPESRPPYPKRLRQE